MGSTHAKWIQASWGAGSAVDIDSLYEIAELCPLISSTCTIGTAEELVRLYRVEDFGLPVFRNRIKSVIALTPLQSSEELHLFQEWILKN